MKIKKFVKLVATYLGTERDEFTISFQVEEKDYKFEYYWILEAYLEKTQPELLEQLDIDDFEITIVK